MTDLLTRTCTSWCARTHDEQPGETVICESTPAYLEQIPGGGSDLTVQVSHLDGEQPRLHLSDYDFDLAGVQRLRRELEIAEQMMHEVSR